jgi:uncharacterized protein
MEADESLLSFPCAFPIKAMGKADDDFDALIVEIVRKFSPDLQEGAVKSRLSKEGGYVSVTVTIQALSQEQLDNIYMQLTAEKRVLMAL